MLTRSEIEDAAKEELTVISAEIRKLRAELAEVVDSVARAGRDRAEAFAHSETITKGLAAGEAAVSDLAAELRALEADIAKTTRRFPWRALGVAALLGLVAGLFLRR